MSEEPPQRGGEPEPEDAADAPLQRSLDSTDSTHNISGKVVHAAGAELLGRVADAGEHGLIVPDGAIEENLHGGLLGFWGLVESTSEDGQKTFRLPAESRLDIINAVRNAELGRVKEELDTQGYALTSFSKMGFSGPNFSFSKHLLSAYYNAGLLKEHDWDRPPDRGSARGAAYFGRVLQNALYIGEADGSLLRGGGMFVGEYPDRTVVPRTNDNIDPDTRGIPPRIPVENDDSLLMYAAFLGMLSSEMFSTVGLNAYDTKTDIVQTTHQDGVEINSTAVVEVEAHGGETLLFRNDNGKVGKLVFQQKLESDDIFVFKDNEYWHANTMLVPRFPGHNPRRRALIGTAEPGHKYNWPQNLPKILQPAA